MKLAVRPAGGGFALLARARAATASRAIASATALLRALCVARLAARRWSLIVAIAYQVVNGSRLSISHFGLGFLGHTTWKPNFDQFGAGDAALRDGRQLGSSRC